MADFDLSNLPENVKAIPLTKGYHALVDAEYLENLNTYSWHVYTDKRGYKYAATFIKKSRNEGDYFSTLRMHRIIMNAPVNLWVDHINGDGLDNRKCNLRLCTNMQNQRNSAKRKGTASKYKGITFHKPRQTWHAKIRVNKKVVCLGYYKTELEAANAYYIGAKKYFGEFARVEKP